MNTRTIVSSLFLGCLACAGAFAQAGESSMGGEMSSDALGSPATGVATMESASRGSSGGEAGYYGSAGGDAPVDEPSVTRAAAEVDSTTTPASAPAPARATTTGTTPSSPSRARNGNRWQSLVPGAIK